YHQICLGLTGADPRDYIHAQLTTLKAAMAHPVIQRLPLDLRSASAVFRVLRNALGVANVSLSDTRRADCTATLWPRADGCPGTLALTYRPRADDRERIAVASRRVRDALKRLGCVAPAALSHVRPKGASVHYAGLIPAGAAAPLTADADGRWREWSGVVL